MEVEMSLDKIISRIEELASERNTDEYNRLLELLKELKVYKQIGSIEEVMDKFI